MNECPSALPSPLGFGLLFFLSHGILTLVAVAIASIYDRHLYHTALPSRPSFTDQLTQGPPPHDSKLTPNASIRERKHCSTEHELSTTYLLNVNSNMAPALDSSFYLFARAQDPNNPPLPSVFALVIDRARALGALSARALSTHLASRDTRNAAASVQRLSIIKRQEQMLVIPTTYAHLNDSPKPGSVVGITLGAIAGFLLALFLFLWIFRLATGKDSETVVAERVISRHSRAQSRKRSVTASSMSEVAVPPPVVESRRVSRTSRRESRRTSRTTRPRQPDTVIVEEELSAEDRTVSEPAEVVVEEEGDDYVEVIEEHSPEPPPRRKASKRSGYRTVDPGAYGGGDAPSRRMSRRDS